MNKKLQNIFKKDGKICYWVWFLIPFALSQLIMMNLPVFARWWQNIFFIAILPMWIMAGLIIWITQTYDIVTENKKWWIMLVFIVGFSVCLFDGAIGLFITMGGISTILGFVAMLIAWIISKSKKTKQKR